jgi:hypothetical protein
MVNTIRAAFSSSINVLKRLSGDARPKPFDHKEHFGYVDGISQPALWYDFTSSLVWAYGAKMYLRKRACDSP